MIKKINKIKDFGVFQNLKSDEQLSNFKKFNIFYGWNYSGKSTLSRIFRTFELQSPHKDFPTAEIQFIDSEETIIENYNKKSYCFRIFNEDFINDNIKWENMIKPILMVGEQNIKLEEELKNKNKELSDCKLEIENIKDKKIKLDDNKQKLLSDQARNIKTVLSLPNFDKSKLLLEISKIIDAPKKYQLSDNDLSRLIAVYNNKELKEKIIILPEFQNNLNQLNKDYTMILENTVKNNIIEELKVNQELSSWIEKGIKLHKNDEKCKFCKGDLQSDLINRYNRHFSDSFNNLKNQIAEFKNRIRSFRCDMNLFDKNKLYQEYQNEYEKIIMQFESEKCTYNNLIIYIESKIKEKEDNLFEKLKVEIIQFNDKEINQIIRKLNSIINNHNSKIENFEKEFELTKSQILKHYASSFFIETNFSEFDDKINALVEEINEKTKIENQLLSDINVISKKIEEEIIALNKLNDNLRFLFFNRSDLKFDILENNKFLIFRNGKEAKNLSQGERSAIAFVYFYTKLYDKDTDLENSIIFIDDPISSLDANHLFSIYSLIKNEFSKCKQLFITTHSFEFFNLFKDWLIDDEKKNSNFFLIHRKDDNFEEAEIKNIPDLLIKFKSEYHYLFSILHKFNASPNNNFTDLYNLPNIVRRFLEAFLGFKFPKAASLQKKLPFILNDDIENEMVFKFINQYSHNNSLPRSLAFPDLQECKNVVNIVLSSIKKNDENHFNALIDFIY